MAAAPPRLPAYGTASLAEVVPSLLAALGAEGSPNALEVPRTHAAVLFVVDGLGWELLRAHADAAPFLAPHLPAARAITAGYPASTATSLAMLSTARPPIAHGLTGYTMAAPGLGRAMSNLAWATHGPDSRDLRDEVVPERTQPFPTAFELAAAAGVTMAAVAPAEHAGSGLTRAILRNGRYVPVGPLDEPPGRDAVADALRGPAPVAVYTYDPTVDGAGHRHGPGSERWRAALARIDRICEALAALLPPDGLLAVTADHGMVDLSVPDARRLDVADNPELSAGVRYLAGEARARHVHVEVGESRGVLGRWRDLLGDDAWVVSREEAIEAGWFGPPDALHPGVEERIGDVVAAAATPTLGVFQRQVDPGEASLAGHHGSLSDAELLVPWILVRA